MDVKRMQPYWWRSFQGTVMSNNTISFGARGLMLHAMYESCFGDCFPTQRELVDRSGQPQHIIRQYISELIERGWLIKRELQRPSRTLTSYEQRHWSKMRAIKIGFSENSCELCSMDNSAVRFCYGHSLALDIHHRTYERFGHEHLSDLETLCRHCHRMRHGLRFPTYQDFMPGTIGDMPAWETIDRDCNDKEVI